MISYPVCWYKYASGFFLQEMLHEFAIVAEKNYHKLSGLEEQKFIILEYWSSDVCNGSTGFLLEALEKNPFPYFFQFLEDAGVFWLRAPITDSVITSSLSLSLMTPSYKGPYDCSGLTR